MKKIIIEIALWILIAIFIGLLIMSMSEDPFMHRIFS